MEKIPEQSPADRILERQAQIRGIINDILRDINSEEYPPTTETKIDGVWWRASQLEDAGLLPYGVAVWDVYDTFLAMFEGE